MKLIDLFDNVYRPIRRYLDPRLVDRGQRPCDILPPITAVVAAKEVAEG